MAMKRDTLYSRVRKVMREVGKRQICQRIRQILEKFAKEFGDHRVSSDQDGTSVEQKLFIFTGKEYISLERTVSEKRQETIKVFLVDFSSPKRSGSILFHAKSVTRYEVDRLREVAQAIRLVELGKHDWVIVEEYHPAQWERVLELHEAERLLKERWKILEAVRLKDEAEKKKGESLTPAEEKLAKDFASAKP